MRRRSLLTRLEAAQYLKISPSTLDRRRKAGIIRDIPLGERTVRFDPDALVDYERARRAAGTPAVRRVA